MNKPKEIKNRWAKKDQKTTNCRCNRKLNHAKGYDIYKDAIIKILNEFPESKIHSITELTEANEVEEGVNNKFKKEK